MLPVGLLAWGSALVLLPGCGSDADGHDPVVPIATQDPVRAFAPAVDLHPDETHPPISAREFIGYSTLSWAIDGCSDETLATGGPRLRLDRDEKTRPIAIGRLGGVVARPYRHRPVSSVDCASLLPDSFSTNQRTRPYDDDAAQRPAGLPEGDGFYLDLLTDRYDDPGAVSTRGLAAIPVYAETSRERVAGKRGMRIAYWLLYSGDDAHEGDWERVEVLVRRDRPGVFTPWALRLDIDGRSRDIRWDEVRRVGDAPGSASHPVISAALGSHTPSIDEGVANCDRCRWRTWTTVLDLHDQPWHGFGGAWGSVDFGDEVSGPAGPP